MPTPSSSAEGGVCLPPADSTPSPTPPTLSPPHLHLGEGGSSRRGGESVGGRHTRPSVEERVGNKAIYGVLQKWNDRNIGAKGIQYNTGGCPAPFRLSQILHPTCSAYISWNNVQVLMFKVSKWLYQSSWYNRIICKNYLSRLKTDWDVQGV